MSKQRYELQQLPTREEAHLNGLGVDTFDLTARCVCFPCWAKDTDTQTYLKV